MGGEKVGPDIGIDLGTTNLRMAVSKHGHESIIPNDQGYSMTPSYIAFTENELLVGNEAKNQVARNPSNTVFGKVSNMTFFLIYLSENDNGRFDVASEIRFVEGCHVKETVILEWLCRFYSLVFSPPFASCVFFCFLIKWKESYIYEFVEIM